MFKFLRKYNKWILAVGGTLLMIVFLIPQAIDTLSQRAAIGSAVWGTVGPNEKDVSSDTRRECEGELEILDTLGMANTDRAEHWYLLTREADQMGLIGALASDQLPSEQMARIAAVAGRSSRVDRAVGKRLSVDRMLSMYAGAAKLSDARLRRRAQRLLHSADVRIVALQGSADTPAPDPAEEEILAHFDKYKDVDPGTPGEDGQPAYGYRLPNRFKVEWLTVPIANVRQMVIDGGLADGVAAYKHWQRHAAARGFPAFDGGATVPEQVREDLINELTTAKLEEIEKFANDKLVASWRRLPTLEGYRVLPEDWTQKQVRLETLATQLQTEYPDLPLPAYRAVGDRWLTLADVPDLESLGDARATSYGPQPIDAATFIAAAKELDGSLSIIVQKGVAGPPLRTRQEDLVFFRLTDVDPARPPHDLDEVRDKVVEDLRRWADYQRIRARADSIEADARRSGLLQIALEHDADVSADTEVHLDNVSLLTFQLKNNIPLDRLSALPVVGPHRPTVEKIIDHSIALGDDMPVAVLKPEDRIFVVPVDDLMSLLVVELVSRRPLDNQSYEELVDLGLPAMMISDDLTSLDERLDQTFGYDALANRHNFTLAVRQTDDASDPTTQPE